MGNSPIEVWPSTLRHVWDLGFGGERRGGKMFYFKIKRVI